VWNLNGQSYRTGRNSDCLSMKMISPSTVNVIVLFNVILRTTRSNGAD
jgi:hypothetical protein